MTTFQKYVCLVVCVVCGVSSGCDGSQAQMTMQKNVRNHQSVVDLLPVSANDQTQNATIIIQNLDSQEEFSEYKNLLDEFENIVGQGQVRKVLLTQDQSIEGTDFEIVEDESVISAFAELFSESQLLVFHHHELEGNYMRIPSTLQKVTSLFRTLLHCVEMNPEYLSESVRNFVLEEFLSEPEMNSLLRNLNAEGIDRVFIFEEIEPFLPLENNVLSVAFRDSEKKFKTKFFLSDGYNRHDVELINTYFAGSPHVETVPSSIRKVYEMLLLRSFYQINNIVIALDGSSYLIWDIYDDSWKR